MPKPNLEEVLDVGDPMLNDNFDLIFTEIPGGGDGRKLRIQCKSGIKPGMSVQQAEMELFGHKTVHAARKTFSNSMSISFHESFDGLITTTLEAWSEECRGTETQSGKFKKDYTTTGTITIYDQTGEEALTYEIFNCWPTEVPDSSFDGSGGTAMTVDATFAYDYYKRKS
jgi:hypothetical protein